MLVPFEGTLSLAKGDNREGAASLFVNKGSSKKQQFPTASEALEAAVAAKVPGKTGVRVDGEYIPLAEAVSMDVAAYVWQSEGRAPGWKVQLWTTEGVEAYNEGHGRKKAKKKKPAAKKTPPKNAPLF